MEIMKQKRNKEEVETVENRKEKQEENKMFQCYR